MPLNHTGGMRFLNRKQDSIQLKNIKIDKILLHLQKNINNSKLNCAMKKIYYMLLLAVISMTVVSCNDWDSPYPTDRLAIVGSWESYYGCQGNYEYDIMGYDRVRYDFFANYTGRYTYYDRYYGLSYVDFDWDAYGNTLIIRYYDGDNDYLYYGYDHNGDLLLALDSHFYQFTAYRPAGYWGPAKEVTKTLNKDGKVENGEAMSASRAVKAKEDLTVIEEK